MVAGAGLYGGSCCEHNFAVGWSISYGLGARRGTHVAETWGEALGSILCGLGWSIYGSRAHHSGTRSSLEMDAPPADMETP
jgi:hypothetical protein